MSIHSLVAIRSDISQLQVVGDTYHLLVEERGEFIRPESGPRVLVALDRDDGRGDWLPGVAASGPLALAQDHGELVVALSIQDRAATIGLLSRTVLPC